ncbi:MAG TPA: hypothetical protein VGC36_10690 [Rhizomicrobium sp.]
MLHVKIGELKNGLSRFLRKVKAGESVTVYDRDTPIARIEPLPAEPQRAKTMEEHFAMLVAQGKLVPPKNPNADLSFLLEPPPTAKASVLEALLEERREDWR